MLPGKYGHHPKVRTVAKNLFEVIVRAHRETILVCSTAEHGCSEGFCNCKKISCEITNLFNILLLSAVESANGKYL